MGQVEKDFKLYMVYDEQKIRYTIGLTDALEEVVAQSYGLHKNTCFNYIIF